MMALDLQALRVVPREQSRADAMLDHASEDGFFQGRIPTYVRPRPATPCTPSGSG